MSSHFLEPRKPQLNALAAGSMRALTDRPTDEAVAALPFAGARKTLDLQLSEAVPLDREGLAPDHIARMIIGADRTADTLPLYRMFEHFSNALAMLQAASPEPSKRK